MKTVLAQGTFDILHPGHVHYLEQAATYGDELHVIVARTENISHKPQPILPSEQRRKVVDALEPVDCARIGHQQNIFVPLEEIQPDIIVLGYDQHHDEEALESMLRKRGFDCRIERTSQCPKETRDELHSSSAIINRILKARRQTNAPPAVTASPWSY